MKRNLLSIFAMAMLFVFASASYAQTTYTKVNSASELEAGAQYILVGYDNDGNAYAMGYQKTNNRHALPVEENGGSITVVVATASTSQVDPFEFTLEDIDGSWTIFDPLNNGYLYAAGGGNYLKTQPSLDDKGYWTITDGEEGMVPISQGGGVEQNIMRYNTTSTLFGCYKSSSNVIGEVYFFKAGGAPVIYPEPSNYPTGFTAMVSNLDVTLNWTDATGAQLPSRYLVLASKGNITVPTDGTPVADGNLAKNVNYGTQTVVFSGLESGATYHFAIFPYTNNGANINFKTDGTYPTTSATTESFFLFEDFNTDDLGQFTAISVVGEQVWQKRTFSGITCAYMNGYASSVNYENEDWLISRPLYVPSDASYLDLEFSTAMRYAGDPLRVKVSGDYSGEGDPNNATWVDITNDFTFDDDENSFVWTSSGASDILPYVNHSFRLAFVYTSTDEAASTWEIDYVMINTDGSVSVDEHSVQAVNVYPNPANSVISFKLENDAEVSIFDITGRMVSSMTMVAGVSQCQVADLENGVYFLNVRYADGKMEVARFVKF